MNATPAMFSDPDVLPLIAEKPGVSVVFVSPEIATRWLERNTRNRTLRQADVDAYARDMRAGDWKLTGEAVKFAKDGTLLDGQHRLWAVVESGVTIPLHVVRGLEPEAQRVMDTGRKRTAADALSIAGEKNSAQVAAVIRLALAIEAEAFARLDKYQVTHAEVETYLASHPEVRDAVDDMKQLSRKTDCVPAVVSYTYLRLSKITQPEAYRFWYDAAEKVGLQSGDPVIALTNRFAEARRNRQVLSKPILLSLIYRAWNARREGKTMRFVRVNSSAGGVVPIPEPK